MRVFFIFICCCIFGLGAFSQNDPVQYIKMRPGESVEDFAARYKVDAATLKKMNEGVLADTSLKERWLKVPPLPNDTPHVRKVGNEYSVDTAGFFKTVELPTTKVQKQKNKKYKKGEEVDPVTKEKAEFYLARAMKAIDAKAYNDAQIYVQRAIKLNPNYTEAYLVNADLYALWNVFDKAVKEYDKAIETDSGMAIAYYNRGSILLKMNEPGKALENFTQAIRLDSTYALAYGGRASIFMLSKDYLNAEKDFTKIIDLNPHFGPAYKGRGVSRLNTGDYYGAIVDFNKSLEIDKDDAYVYYQRGMAKLSQSKTYDACLDFLAASKLGYSEADKAIKKYCN